MYTGIFEKGILLYHFSEFLLTDKVIVFAIDFSCSCFTCRHTDTFFYEIMTEWLQEIPERIFPGSCRPREDEDFFLIHIADYSEILYFARLLPRYIPFFHLIFRERRDEF
jgi:hypothetical protein